MATVRVSFLLAGKRFHRRLNRSVLSDVPAEATRVNRAGPDHKVIRLRGLSHARQYGTNQAVFLRRGRTRAVISPSPSPTPFVRSGSLCIPDRWRTAEPFPCRRLQRADVEKHIRTARVVLDETEAAVGLPHFQSACSHRALFPLRLQRQCQKNVC
jgi:hypothetical protein